MAREASLRQGDAVLIFTHTLDYDRKLMFDAIATNLNAGVTYRYMLCGDTLLVTDWELFIRALKAAGVAVMPEAVREDTLIAPIIVATVAIYEYGDPKRDTEAISVLQHVAESDACVVLSPQVSRHVRDTFWRVWNKLAQAPDRRLPA